jgi:uncharacterized protein YhaN
MILRRIEVKAFGRFTDLELENLSSGLVVVHGPNEAGKSTLFSLLTTLLYGFYPVQGFPYRPWHADRHPEMNARLTAAGGEEIEVWRKLAASPQGRMLLGGQARELSNHDLPFVRHVNRTLYKSLYALTQANMRSLEEQQRQEIEDRLLSGLGADVLRPARAAAAEAEAEAARLWRPDNRGKPEHKKLMDELREAKSLRREAEAQDRSVREKAARLEETGERIERLEAELARLNVFLRKADELLPLKKRLQRIDELKDRIGHPEEVRRLPQGVEGEYRRLCREAELRRKEAEKLRQERKKQEAAIQGFGEEHERLLEASQELEAWLRFISAHEQEGRNIGQLAEDVGRMEESLAERARTVFSKPFAPQHLEPLRRLALPELKGRIDRFREMRDRAEGLRQDEERMEPVYNASGLPRWLPAVLGGLGAGLAITGYFAGHALVWASAGFFLLAAAGTGFMNLYLRRQLELLRRKARSEAERAKKRRERAESDAEEARLGVESALAELPVADVLLENPDLELYRALEGLCTQAAEHERMSGHYRERLSRWREKREELNELLQRFDEEASGPEGFSRLEKRFREAQACREAARAASQRISELDEALGEAEAGLRETRNELDELLRAARRATGAGQEDDETVVARAAEQQKTEGRVRELQRQLEDEYPNLPELVREMERIEREGEDFGTLDPEEVERSRSRRDDTSRELQELKEERAGLLRDIDNSRSKVSAGELDGRIESLRERIRDVCARRDRLALAAQVLREADRSFREKHQPDVLRRAGGYLNAITGGRYPALVMLQDEKGAEHLHVQSAAGDYLPVQQPLSAGTLDQIHLAFRLAVIDHLDQDREPLPLVMDEVLINWDDERFRRGAELLADIAGRRQVFLFTCHSWLAQRLLRDADASAVQLDGGRVACDREQGAGP